MSILLEAKMFQNPETRKNLIIDDAIERFRTLPDCETPPDLRASILRQIRAIPEPRGFFDAIPSYFKYAASGALATATILLILYIHPSAPAGRWQEAYTKANFISDSIKLARESYQTDAARRKAESFMSKGGRL